MQRRWWMIGLAALALVALGLAYRDLLTLGSRLGDLETGVEYWLFVPNDRAPAIVLLLSAWLTYRRWPRLSRLPTRAAAPWLLAPTFAFGLAMQGWAIHVRAEDLQAISLILNLSGLVMLRWGLPGLRVMWLPLAFLIFCLPIPAPLLVTLLWKLRLVTAEYTGWLLYLIGVPSFVSGDQILRATQNFQVIEGCSGLRSSETLTMLVVLLVDLFGRRGLHAAILLVAAPFVAFALNGVRVLTLVLNPHSEIVAIHSLQGVAILLVGLLGIYALDGALARVLSRGSDGPAGASPGAGGPDRTTAPTSTLFAVVAVALATAGMALAVPEWGAPRPQRTLHALIDEVLDGKKATEIDPEHHFLGRIHFRESLHRSYPTQESALEVFIGSADLRNRRTSIVSPIIGIPGSGWQIRSTRRTRISEGRAEVVAQIVEKGTSRRLSYHWFLGSLGLPTETLRSFLGLERSELHRPLGQLAIRLSTPIEFADGASLDRARRRLDKLYDDLEPALERALVLVPAEPREPRP